MKITKEDIDALNSVVKIDISVDDYQDKVDNQLQDYRKKANIPGFRKGHVPMSLVKKQYGKSDHAYHSSFEKGQKHLPATRASQLITC